MNSLLKTVEKRGSKYCTVHGHPKKAGSKTDKPPGSVIACHDTRKEAESQRTAIRLSKLRKRGKKIPKKKLSKTVIIKACRPGLVEVQRRVGRKGGRTHWQRYCIKDPAGKPAVRPVAAPRKAEPRKPGGSWGKMMLPTERETAAIRTGNPAAIGKYLADRLYPGGRPLRQLPFPVPEGVDPEDIHQTMVMKAMERPHLIAGAENVGSYVTTAMRRIAVDLARKQGRETPSELTEDIQAQASAMPRDQFERAARIRTALDRVRDEIGARRRGKDRDLNAAIWTMWINGKGPKEISRELGRGPDGKPVGESAIKTRIHGAAGRGGMVPIAARALIDAGIAGNIDEGREALQLIRRSGLALADDPARAMRKYERLERAVGIKDRPGMQLTGVGKKRRWRRMGEEPTRAEPRAAKKQAGSIKMDVSDSDRTALQSAVDAENRLHGNLIDEVSSGRHLPDIAGGAVHVSMKPVMGGRALTADDVAFATIQLDREKFDFPDRNPNFRNVQEARRLNREKPDGYERILKRLIPSDPRVMYRLALDRNEALQMMVAHETAHVLHHLLSDDEKRVVRGAFRTDSRNVSVYGKQDADEFMAESYVAWRFGHRDRVHDDMLGLFEGKYGEPIEKAAPAQVGEVRTHGGIKKKKIAPGKWEPVGGAKKDEKPGKGKIAVGSSFKEGIKTLVTNFGKRLIHMIGEGWKGGGAEQVGAAVQETEQAAKYVKKPAEEKESKKKEPEKKEKLKKAEQIKGRPGLSLIGNPPRWKRTGKPLEREPERAAVEDYRKNGVRSGSFKSWFGDWERDPGSASKVTKAGLPARMAHLLGSSRGGKPMIVYHGGTVENEFSHDRMTHVGFYFSDHESTTGTYGKQRAYYLNIRNPASEKDYDRVHAASSHKITADFMSPDWLRPIREALKAEGYDGIRIESMNEWIAFEPEQIKATGNRGTFDPKSRDVFKAMEKAKRHFIVDEPGRADLTGKHDTSGEKATASGNGPAGFRNGSGGDGAAFRCQRHSRLQGAEGERDAPRQGTDYRVGQAAGDRGQGVADGSSGGGGALRGHQAHRVSGAEEVRKATGKNAGTAADVRIVRKAVHGPSETEVLRGSDVRREAVKGQNARGAGPAAAVGTRRADAAGSGGGPRNGRGRADRLPRPEPRPSVPCNKQAGQPVRRQIQGVGRKLAGRALQLIKTQTFTGWKLQGRRKFRGLDISVENRAGSVRKGTDPDGKEWETRMKNDYGYIRQTNGVRALGRDGEKLDCFIGPDEDAPNVTVVRLKTPSGKYDEDKAMLGFSSRSEALGAWRAHYDDPDRYYMDDYTVPWERFDKMLKKSRLVKTRSPCND